MTRKRIIWVGMGASLLLVAVFALFPPIVWLAKFYEEKILQTASALFQHYAGEEVFLTSVEIEQDLTDEQKGVLRFLRTPFVQVTYDHDQSRSVFLEADSVVLFTKTGILIIGYERNIVVDLRKDIGPGLKPKVKYNRFFRIGERMYFIKENMPAF